MGGGGTTTVDGGLSDDQYQDLADNQVGISGQITDEAAEANKRFDTFDGRFDTVDSSVAGVGSSVNTGFTNIQDLMDKYNTSLNTQLTNANTGIANNATSMANNATANANTLSDLNTSVTGGFDEAGRRFDTVDAANTNMQNAVDQGFVDQAQGFTDAQADRTAQFGAAQDDRTNQFSAASDALSTGFNDANTALTQTQANVLNGQGGLQSSLDTMADTADIYATQSLENQAGLASNQEGFTSSFDDYVERYGEDAELAQQTRADMQKANANANQRLREDIGNYANASVAGTENLGNALMASTNALGSAVEGGFSDLSAENSAISGSLEGGFNTLGDTYEATQNNLGNRMNNLKSLLNQTGADLDANTRAQYQALSSSFDENGQLISNSIDAQGNTLTRTMDDQGNMITSKFDASGQQVDQVSTNVNEVLTQAENNQKNNLNSLNEIGNIVNFGFADTNKLIDGATDLNALGFAENNANIAESTRPLITGMNRLEAGRVDSNNSMDDIRKGLDTGFANISRANDLSDINNNLERINSNNISTNTSLRDLDLSMGNRFNDASKELSLGFNNIGAGQITAARDLAKVASTQNDLDIGMRQNFHQLGNAFDDTGALIKSSIDAQGNTITRNMDQQGNLLLRSFDVTGRAIGDKVININRSLTDLQNMQNVQGANASMGNLSPAMSGQVPVSGFASPFATTR